MNLIKWWNINIGNEEKKKLNYALTKKFISQGPLTMELEKKISKFLWFSVSWFLGFLGFRISRFQKVI